jgi:hypothetical protein
MATLRKFVVYAIGIATAIAMLFSAALVAQEAEDEQADEVDTIEEIIVVAPRPGGRKRVDQKYEDPVRAQLLMDFYKMQEDQEEFEWRIAAVEESPSRISWGYDPSDEYRLRNELALQELPSERTRPATIFRIKF